MQSLANIWSLLGVDANWGKTPTWVQNILKPVVDLLDVLLTPLLILVASGGVIYVIILGVNYARAESSDKKDEAKKRIINAVVGLVIMVVLLFIMFLVIENIDEIVSWITE